MAMFSMIWVVFFSGILSLGSSLVYDFEDNADGFDVVSSSSSNFQLSSSQHKSGTKSLEWQWTEGEKLTWTLLPKQLSMTNSAGLKIWIYNSNPLSGECLLICLGEKNIPSQQSRQSCFPMSLDFEGWRAAWVTYSEFRGCPRTSSTPPPYDPPSDYSGWNIKNLTLIAPSGASLSGTLYIDLLRLLTKVSGQTRDSVVPPLSYKTSAGTLACTTCAQISAGLLTEEDALAFHERKSFWQQIYRWSLRSPSTLPTTVEDEKLTDINRIVQRLINWYANESTMFTSIPEPDSPSGSFLAHRWHSLRRNIDRAHREFAQFTTMIGGSRKLTTGLFARNSEYGDPDDLGGEKFSSILHKVLHPLSIEYYIKSRSIEVNHATCEFAKIYKCTPGTDLAGNDVKAITGKDSDLRRSFTSSYSPVPSLPSTPMHSSCSGVSNACFDHVKAAINSVNEDRKEKILKLFDYLKKQGFANGSALGSNDHGPLGMSGFFHSVFLMKNQLDSAGKLNYVIGAMKWYTDFGEIYQSTFEFNGTTADRIRTLMFFRLMNVLVMPEGSVDQKKEKIRDMNALKLWIENALNINEGLAGLIKPDFTSFHHKTFYAGAYTPQALHTAALISYLLEGTAYELHREIRKNLVNALKVFRIVAVRYSTPSAIGGRYPNYTKAVLAEHVPAYAYISANPSTSSEAMTLNTQLAEVRMFLRLYEHTAGTCAGPLNTELCDGKVDRKYYLNSLGSLEIMDKVKELALAGSKTWGNRAELSPEGHWSKQFATLTIHRRNDWAVTVKGFDKFVWDFENSDDENRYGMYASHGAMLIANNESALSSKNVDGGWDWRKIPGTTVINTTFSRMLLEDDRHYVSSPESMVGGVTFAGSTPSPNGIFGRNGVFGFHFVNPSYESASYFSAVSFSFKKSVFFYDDIIVSLGSNIEYSGGAGRTDEVHTALFQDKMHTSPPPRIGLNIPDAYRCNDGGNAGETSSWSGKPSVVLVDVNGNRYYIPNPDNQGLVFYRGRLQVTVNSTGVNKSSRGTYCTAWFNHGTNPSGTKNAYEYAVQVDAEPVGGTDKQSIPSNFYSVIKKDVDAHVVKFLSNNQRGTVHGYVVFPLHPPDPINLSSGPLTSVHNQSIIMVEEKTGPDKLYISVTSPQLNLTKDTGSPSWCAGENTSPTTSDDVDEVLLYCSRSKAQEVHVNIRNTWSTWSMLKSFHVGGKDKMGEESHYLKQENPPTEELVFINLRNGADTELSFEKSRRRLVKKNNKI